MCSNVIIHKHDGTAITCEGYIELCNAIGKNNVVADCEMQADECLCPVDFQKTARNIGRVATQIDPSTGEFDPFDWHFVPEKPIHNKINKEYGVEL